MEDRRQRSRATLAIVEVTECYSLRGQYMLLLLYSVAAVILITGFTCLAASSAIDVREWPGIFWIILAGPEAWHRCRKILDNRQPRIPMLPPDQWVNKRSKRDELADLRAALAVEQERL